MTLHTPNVWHLDAEREVLSPRAIAASIASILAALYAVALLLVARRAMGAFTAELPWPALVITALSAFAVITGLRILWRRTFPEPTAGDQWIGWGASLTMLLIAGGLSFPVHERDWFIWLPILVCDQLIRRRLFDDVARIGNVIAKPQAANDAIQQMIRTRDADARETVQATLRADFVPAQRTATVYVGYCPPLESQPELTIEPVPGADCKIVQAFPHGARIDVRLAHVAQGARSVAVNITARG